MEYRPQIDISTSVTASSRRKYPDIFDRSNDETESTHESPSNKLLDSKQPSVEHENHGRIMKKKLSTGQPAKGPHKISL